MLLAGATKWRQATRNIVSNNILKPMGNVRAHLHQDGLQWLVIFAITGCK
jgi:hypothetical protein